MEKISTAARNNAATVPMLKEVASTRVWSDRRLRQAWELRGGHPTTYRCTVAYEEVRDRGYLQVIALGHADAAKHLSIREGPETVSKVVGWARAKIQDISCDESEFADIENMFIDSTVETSHVRAFLLRRLQEKVCHARKKIGALRVEVNGDDPEGALFYWRLGFRESGCGNEFIWYPA